MKSIHYWLRLQILTLILCLSAFTSNAQVAVKWKSELNSDIYWQEVTALGNLIVSTGSQLSGVSTESGEILWSKPDLARLDRASYQELANSPFFTITRGNRILLIDQLSGDLVFDSKKSGIATIQDYFFLYNTNSILVAGKTPAGDPKLTSVNMSDGSVSWSMNEKFGRIIAARELNTRETLIVTLFNNYKLNAHTGKIIWKEANSAESAQVAQLGAFGAFLQDAAENLTKDQEIDLRFYQMPGSDIFYLGSQQESQSSMSTNGEPAINYTNVYNAFSTKDGKLLWKKPLELKGKIGHIAFMDKGLLVLPDNGNRTKINLFDYDSQQGLWGKKGKGIAIKGGIYDYLESEDGMLLVSQTTNKNFLNYLNTSTGLITFDKPVKVDGRVIGMLPLDQGILYITSESMNILDPKSGSLKWSKSIRTNPELTAHHQGKVYAFDYKTRKLMVIDEKTETLNELSGYELKFLGGESPKGIEILDDGVFIYSDQNVAKIGFDGLVKFQEYYPAPREPAWKRALLYAEAVRGAYLGLSSYYVSGVMAASENDVRAQDEVAGELVHQIGNAYGELGDQASSYAVSAFKQANARVKATKLARDFMFVMSKTQNNIELLKVSKSTGKVDGRIDLGKDREPVYAVDDVTGQVYYRADNNVLTSYQVK